MKESGRGLTWITRHLFEGQGKTTKIAVSKRCSYSPVRNLKEGSSVTVLNEVNPITKCSSLLNKLSSQDLYSRMGYGSMSYPYYSTV